ncbi:MAG TPA: hypothetical protein DDW86_05060 [Clostridiales bacterium]|nr:hypothetical protein [Clostridiales bacterium]
MFFALFFCCKVYRSCRRVGQKSFSFPIFVTDGQVINIACGESVYKITGKQSKRSKEILLEKEDIEK